MWGGQVIKYSNDKPIFKQLEERFINNIQTGIWPVHTKIKDEIELSAELQVSRGTLRKAIKSLVEKGLLSQIKGKGTFVVSNDIEQPLASRLVSFSEAMKEKSLSFKTVLLKKEILIPDLKVAAFLEIPHGDKVVFIERVRLIDNYPVIYFKNYVHLCKCPDIMDDDLENQTLFSLIEEKYNHKIKWGRRYFKAISALGDVAFNLGLSVGTPVMYLEQVTYTHGNVPVEYSNVWINSEKFEILSVIPR